MGSSCRLSLDPVVLDLLAGSSCRLSLDPVVLDLLARIVLQAITGSRRVGSSG